MTAFDKFFADAYELVDVLKSSEHAYIAVVYDKHAGHLCVMKRRALRSMELYKLLKTCDNAHLPKIYRLFERDGDLIVIEEHIDGQTLDDMLTYQPTVFDEAFVLNILEQLCNCLIDLHAINIIHRDIKPSNIMIDRQNVVKLIDFGIARIFKPTGVTDTEFLGTRGYAAPEQFGLFDLGQSDARTDIHALAVTARQLLGEDYRGRILPVLERCTSLNPNDRYQSVADLVHAVKRTRKLQLFKRVASIAAMTVIAFALPQLIELETPEELPSNAIETPEPSLEKPIEMPEPLKHSEPPATFDPIPTLEPVIVPESIPTLTPVALTDPPSNADRTPPTLEIAKRPEFSLYINGELTPNIFFLPIGRRCFGLKITPRATYSILASRSSSASMETRLQSIARQSNPVKQSTSTFRLRTNRR